MNTQGTSHLSEEEYREREELSTVKNEWFAGQIFPMETNSFNHVYLSGNIVSALMTALEGKNCVALGAQMRIKVEASGLHTYPDALIFCPPARFEGKGDNTLLTPKVIFEILSPSTEKYDRTDKFNSYAKIETFTDYVLIDAERVFLEHFQRVEDGWLLRSYSRLDETLIFSELDISLPLAEIYDDLELPEQMNSPQVSAELE